MAVRKWPWGRIITGSLAVVIVLLAVPLFLTAADMHERLDAALAAAQLVRVEADCSKTGVYEGSFYPTLGVAYGLNLRIMTKPPLAVPKDVKSALAGLLGQVTIVAPDGAAVYENAFRSGDFAYRRVDRDRWAAATDMDYCPLRGRWHSEGVYRVKLVIDHGAAGLKRIPHAFVVAYQFDGMEALGAFEACLYGVAVCTIAGFLFLAVVLISIAKPQEQSNALGGGSDQARELDPLRPAMLQKA